MEQNANDIDAAVRDGVSFQNDFDVMMPEFIALMKAHGMRSYIVMVGRDIGNGSQTAINGHFAGNVEFLLQTMRALHDSSPELRELAQAIREAKKSIEEGEPQE